MQMENRGRTAVSTQHSAFRQTKDIPTLCRFLRKAGFLRVAHPGCPLVRFKLLEPPQTAYRFNQRCRAFIGDHDSIGFNSPVNAAGL